MPLSRAIPASALGRAPRGILTLGREGDLARGLIAAWPLFAGPAHGRRDLSGKGAHLTFGAAATRPAWTAPRGQDGRALSFDGVDNYAIVGTAFDPGPLPLTFSCWINPPSGYTSAVRAMFSKRTGITPSTARLDLGLYHTTGFVYTYDGNNLRRSTYAPPAGQWTHIAVTIDSSGTATVFANGVSQGGFDGTVTLGTNTGAEARIGHTNDSFGDPFLGQIKEMRFYNRVLSGGAIRRLYGPPFRWSVYRELNAPRLFPVAAGGGPVVKTANDNLNLAIGEAPPDLVAYLQRADALDLGLAEGIAILVTQSRADTLDIALAETSQVAVTLSASDALDLAIAEGPSDLRAALALIDALDIGLGEGVATWVALARTDALDIGLADTATLRNLVAASDALDIAVAESGPDVRVAIAASDALDLTVGEARALMALLARADPLDLATSEARAIQAFVQAADALDLAFIETALKTEPGVLLAAAILLATLAPAAVHTVSMTSAATFSVCLESCA